MKQRFFLALGAFTTCASLLLLGACDGHTWKETQPLHVPHGGHGDHDGDHAADYDAGGEHDKAEGDQGGHEKKAKH